MNFFEILYAQKNGAALPANFFDLLFAKSFTPAAEWGEYDGTLPAQYTANGSTLADYRIYGAAGGVGDRTKQLFNVETAVYRKGYYKNDSGTESMYPGAGYYETYIPIAPSETINVINVHGSQNLTVRLYFYDAQKQWIQCTDGYVEDFSVAAPSNAAYAQLQISPQFIPSPNTIMITQNSTASYEPYGYVIPMSMKENVNIDINKGLYGYTIRAYNNSIEPNASWWVSDYIPVVEGETYTGVYTGQDILLYSEIGGMSTGATGLQNGYTIPQGKHYMRMNVSLTNMNRFAVFVRYPLTPIYIGSDPLDAIGDYADYVDYHAGKIMRSVLNYAFNGTETVWRAIGNYVEIWADKIVPSIVLSSAVRSYSPDGNVSFSNQTYGSTSVIRITVAGISVAADIMPYLKSLYDNGTPAVMWYASFEPVEVDSPVSLPALPTVDGTTITDYAGQSTAVPSRFYAKYQKG